MSSTHTNRFSLQSLEPRQLMAADLWISAIDVAPVVQDVSATTPITITVANSGNTQAAAGVKVKVVFSRDNIYRNSDDLSLGLVTIDQAIAAKSTTQVTLDRRASAQPTGVFQVAAFVDSTNVVAESKERNNVAVSSPGVVTYYRDLNTIGGNKLVGTAEADVFSIENRNDTVLITRNGTVYGAPQSRYSEIFIDAGAGNDVVAATPDFPIRLGITGSNGNDVLVGGAGDDEISGAAGKDRVLGGAGNDLLIGGGGNDRIYGQDGDDLVSGSNHNDLIFGGAGNNTLYGGAGNDYFYTHENNAKDIIDGGTGTDLATVDLLDQTTNTEG